MKTIIASITNATEAAARMTVAAAQEARLQTVGRLCAFAVREGNTANKMLLERAVAKRDALLQKAQAATAAVVELQVAAASAELVSATA